ncbi:unnamed protein product, partial [Staurois parvus]
TVWTTATPSLTDLPHHRLSPLQSILNSAARLIHLTLSSTGLHAPLSFPPLVSIQCPPPLSLIPSTSLHSVSSTPLCHSLHWSPFSVLHPSLSYPPLTSTQCPPPLSVIPSTVPPLSVLHPPLSFPSTGLHSVSSTPLCHTLH